VKDPEQITFPALSAVTTADADFAPGATSTNTNVAITYTSSDPTVATIVSGNIHIVGAGTVTITAHQAGDGSHYAAADVSQSLTVTQATGTKDALVGVVTVYPNPASDFISVELGNTSASEGDAILSDMMGTEISRAHFKNQGTSLKADLSMSNLPEG